MSATPQPLEHRSAPFEIVLDGRPGQPLHCLEVVRSVRARRLVCRARWQQQTVYAKLFLDRRRAARHRDRERCGLVALTAAGIPAPTVLYHGSAEAGQLAVVVVAEITDACSVLEAWEHSRQGRERLELLQRLVRLLATHHRHGIRQRDLHLGNFLLAHGRIYTLDGGTVRVTPGPLGRLGSCYSLARLLAQLPPRDEALAEAGLEAYCAARGWACSRQLAFWVLAQARHLRERRRDRYLAKTVRECTDFACGREGRRFWVYRRRQGSPGLEGLLRDPDRSARAPGAERLKSGNTCTVWSVPLDDRVLVIKRYNIKGFGHRLKRALRRSRAWHAWRNAHRLEYYDIAGAPAVALIEERLGPLRGRAFFITERVEGVRCDQFLLAPPTPLSESDGARQRQALVELLVALAARRISHGDLKATNLMVGARGPVLLDLDAMRQHRRGPWYRQRQGRDLRRFLRNFERDRPLWEQFAGLLERAFPRLALR